MTTLLNSAVSFSQWACTHLWTQFWQITLLAVVLLVVTRMLAKNRPHLAHMLWFLLLLKCVTPPWWSSPSGVFCWMQPAADTQPAGVEVQALHGEVVSVKAVKALATDLPPRTAPEPAYAAIAMKPAETGAVESIDWRQVAVAAACGVWLLGGVVVLGTTYYRWRRVRWCIYEGGVRHDPALDAMVKELSQKMGLRREVQLIVTPGLVGPAVVGILRPLIILPELIASSRTPEQLQPVIAHELMHVRRGDLWTGMLQLVCMGLWWFHPLVWLAGRLLSREAERCCDEQAIAMTGCTPSTYARSLLDVLELKHKLTPVPAFPGVRPVEVTTRRLERIMSLRQGCRRTAPWWCWVVLLGLALVTLPGAAFVVTAAEDAPSHGDLSGGALVTEPDTTVPPRPGSRLVAPGPPVFEQFNVKKLIDRLVERHKFTREQARSYVRNEVLFAAVTPRKADGKVQPFTGQIKWFPGDILIVRDVPAVLENIRKHLEFATRYGFLQVSVETRFISMPREKLAVFGTEFAQLHSVANPGDDRTDAMWKLVPAGGSGVKARFMTEWSEPVAVGTIRQKNFLKALQLVQGDARCNTMMAPKLRLSSGQNATVENATQRPFVVGFAKQDGVLKPQMRVVREGTLLRLHSVANDAGDVELQVRCEMSDIKRVDTRQVVGPTGKPATVQVPVVTRVMMQTAMKVKPGQTLLLGGTPLSGESKAAAGSRLVLALTTTVIPPQPLKEKAADAAAARTRGDVAPVEEPPAEPPQIVKLYAVADLVTSPRRGLVEIDLAAKAIPGKPWKPGKPDFSSLQKLIRSAIAPSTWKTVGGKGVIEPYENNLSLVIRQTADVHRQIEELLKTLRRMQDLQTAVGVQIYKVKSAESKHVLSQIRDGSDVLDAAQIKTLRKSLQSVGAEATGNIKVTLFNGQGMALPVQLDAQRKTRIEMSAVVLEDRKGVQVSFAVDAKDTQQLLARARSYKVQPGGAVVIDVHQMVARAGGHSAVESNPFVQRLLRESRNKNGAVIAILSPQAIVQEEEEVRPMGLDVK